MSIGDIRTRVAVIAPEITCWGLEKLVQSSSSLCLLASFSSLARAMQASWPGDADVVVIDADDAGEPSLLDFLSRSDSRVLLLTAASDLGAFHAAVLRGLHGIVRKSDPPSMLLKAIDRVHAGELWINRACLGRLFMDIMRAKEAAACDPETARIATLTRRERQAIAALAADTSAPGKVIASRLCMSEHTLRNHLSAIYSKLELGNRLDLYAFATRHGLADSQGSKPAAFTRLAPITVHRSPQ
jgi:two-component system, NarL family, nitrate/nitrite response regulator NarL